jgi:hypothetical protein
LDFDLLKDVEPVAQLPNNPLVIVAGKAGPGEQGVDRSAKANQGACSSSSLSDLAPNLLFLLN